MRPHLFIYKCNQPRADKTLTDDSVDSRLLRPMAIVSGSHELEYNSSPAGPHDPVILIRVLGSSEGNTRDPGVTTYCSILFSNSQMVRSYAIVVSEVTSTRVQILSYMWMVRWVPPNSYRCFCGSAGLRIYR